MRSLRTLTYLATALLLVACTQPTDSKSSTDDSVSVTITSVGFVGENIDPSYWSTPLDQTVFFNFWVRYEGEITVSDIKSVIVYDPSGKIPWTIDHTNYLDTTNKVIGGRQSFYIPKTKNSLPIGNFAAFINLKNGKSVSKGFTVTAPNSRSTGSMTSVYGEVETIPEGGTPILPRAVVTSTAVDATSATVRFTLDDSDDLAFSGYVWFYDANGTYLGNFAYMVNPATGSPVSQLNGGSAFVRDGATQNVLTVQPGDAGLTVAASNFTSIAKTLVIITDGAQYTQPASGLYYDYRSYSNRK